MNSDDQTAAWEATKSNTFHDLSFCSLRGKSVFVCLFDFSGSFVTVTK